jgi:hypothetical protein
MALAWHQWIEATITPSLRTSHNIDRTFVADVRTFIAGETPTPDRTRRGTVLTNALQNAARVDPAAARWLAELTPFVTPPAEVLGRSGLTERVLELGDDDQPPPLVGPSRSELLHLLNV